MRSAATAAGYFGALVRGLGLLLCVVALAAAGCGGHAGPHLLVGAVEDAARYSSDPGAKMQLAQDAGFRAVVMSARWSRGADPAAEVPPLAAAADAADAHGIEPVLALYQLGGHTPSSAADRADFARWAAAIVRGVPHVRMVLVANEPNLNLFWRPQFGPDGADVAASSYEALLAQTYDALKSVDPKLEVVGGSLAPRGADDPAAARQTHSPTRFILDMGAALRASGRTRPLMDAFSLHVWGETSRVPPTLRHPRSTSLGLADYPTLVHLLTSAFGAAPPVVYGEYGVETTIPPSKAADYTGHEVVPTVDEATQARYYREAIDLAACQPTVQALFLFHVTDERALSGLQSGLYYADDTPKSSLPAVRDAIEHPTCTR